ncbi:MAG: nucleotide exchange factor GrpE [Nitriliruptoraceae bacterium]
MTTPTPETEPVTDEITAETEPSNTQSASDVPVETDDGDTIDPLTQVTQERDEYLDDLRRARAEFENYRKRMANDSAIQRAHGRHETIMALFEVADDLDRLVTATQTTEETDTGDVARAITLLDSKWRHALNGLNVERIDATGVAFDPTQHDAVSQVAAEEPIDTPVVAQIMRVGYRSGDRVLRPAMVVVAQ